MQGFNLASFSSEVQRLKHEAGKTSGGFGNLGFQVGGVHGGTVGIWPDTHVLDNKANTFPLFFFTVALLIWESLQLQICVGMKLRFHTVIMSFCLSPTSIRKTVENIRHVQTRGQRQEKTAPGFTYVRHDREFKVRLGKARDWRHPVAPGDDKKPCSGRSEMFPGTPPGQKAQLHLIHPAPALRIHPRVR